MWGTDSLGAPADNAIKLAKKLCVSDNLEANKGNLRNSGKTSNILEIKADNKIVSNTVDVAETINEHFTKYCANSSTEKICLL